MTSSSLLWPSSAAATFLAPSSSPRLRRKTSPPTNPTLPLASPRKLITSTSSSVDRVLSGYFSSTPSAPPPPPPSSSSPISRVSRWTRHVRCSAVGGGSQDTLDRTVYQGIYGPWTVDPSDVREVTLYRSGLVTAAATFVIAASVAFLPDNFVLEDVITQNIDLLYAIGAGGLGLSLFLIHIYVTPIKRFLQFLWAIGVLGSLGTYVTLAQPVNESLTKYVIDNPEAVWLVGPLFASLTGLVFKEGLCYGKLEAGILTFTIPALLLGHLTGLMDDGVKLGLLGVWMSLFVVFSGRKFTQPLKDDIGDKSVFIFNALPEEEKEALLHRLEQQSGKELS